MLAQIFARATKIIEKFQRSEEEAYRWQRLFENAEFGLARTNISDNTFLEVNAAFARQRGYTPAELIGRSLFEVYAPEERPKMQTRMPIIDQLGHLVYESVHLRKDGTTFPVMMEVTTIRDIGDQPTSRIAYTLDISKRKQAEEALRESEARYRLISENGNDVIWLFDIAADRFSYVSPSVERLRGYSVAEVLTQNMQDVLVPESYHMISETLPARLAAFIAGDDSVRTQCHEMIQTCKNGRTVPTEVVTTLITDQQRQITHIQGVTRDITSRKQAEEQSRLLRDLGFKLIGASNLAVALQHCLQTAIRIAGMDSGGIYLVDEHTGDLSLACHSGLSNDFVARVKHFRKNTPQAHRAHQGEIFHGNLADLPLPPLSLERQEGLRAVSFLPIQNNGQLVAVCNVASHLLDEISIHARDALETVASLMGGLLQHLRAQEALRESERVQRLALQIGKIGTFEFNYVTNSAIWSPEIANIWGFPGNFNEDFSTFCWDHVHPDDLAVVKAHFSKLLQRQGENEIEFRILRPDGTVRWIRWRGQIILDAAGQATRLIGVNLDISEYKQMADDLRQMNAKLEQRVAERTKELIDEISERKQAEERLRESEQRYRDLIETLPDWVWEVNEDGVYIFSSPQARQLLGYEPDEILGRTPFDLMPPAEALRVKQLVMPLMARGDPFFFLENTVQRKDGRLLTLETSGVPIWDVHGKLRGYRGLDRDISERQRVAAELQRAKETADAASLAKSRFLTNMSHEIRTPLNAILGFAQLMQRNPDISPKQQQQLGIINRSGEHLLRLINDILDMSKIEAGRMQLTLVACDLRSLLEEMTAMFRLHTAEKGLYFEFDQVEDLPTCLYTDAGKIRQVIVNILGNAVRFTNQGGIRIAVTATPIAAKSDSQTDSRFCITITDTGVGIEPDEIGRVFEPFEQTQSGQQQGGGTGLGMSISRQLARMMGGDLTVSSQVGLGSKFCFSFVASVINATHWSTAIKSPTQSLPGFIPDLPPPTVLVLDNIELSADLRAEIIQATEAGDIARLQELIDQDVSGQYPAVGQILRQLLASYNYESILRALRGK